MQAVCKHIHTFYKLQGLSLHVNSGGPQTSLSCTWDSQQVIKMGDLHAELRSLLMVQWNLRTEGRLWLPAPVLGRAGGGPWVVGCYSSEALACMLNVYDFTLFP